MIKTYISVAILVLLYLSVRDINFSNRVIAVYELNKSNLERDITKYRDNCNEVMYSMNEYNRRMNYYYDGIDRLTARKNTVILIGVILGLALIYVNCGV
ncbi:MAG TPA: hypothetical protein PLP75_01555 [Burkholderiales bacterium]|nr:hypothetical protein [Burkholderiales bacterium]